MFIHEIHEIKFVKTHISFRRKSSITAGGMAGRNQNLRSFQIRTGWRLK